MTGRFDPDTISCVVTSHSERRRKPGDKTVYTVHQIGWVYRANGKFWGIKGTISGLTYQDVCGQIVAASRRNEEIRITDNEGKIVSVGNFVLD